MRVLAILGTSPEELDFIINYDIKYRMGDALDNYVEQTVKKWETRRASKR